MAEPRPIPWETVAVEAVAIVLSILLAFAIDAWWTEKQESEVEHAALRALHGDFAASREQLEVVLRFGLISDPQLLGHLSKWRRELDNIEDISFELRAESVLVRRAMQKHGGPFFRWRRSPDGLNVLPRASGETLANLRQDKDFMGTARSHQYALSIYLVELHKLAETLDSTVELLHQITAQR